MPHVRGDHRAQRRQESQPRPDHPGRGGEGGHHPRGGKQQQQQQQQEKMLLLPKSLLLYILISLMILFGPTVVTGWTSS